MKKMFNNAAIMCVLLLLAGLMFVSPANAQAGSDERIYIKIEIEGMACPFCAFGMERALRKVSGVDNVKIELKQGLAYISTPAHQKPSKESLEKIIVNGGFTVGDIEFSDKPFKQSGAGKTH